MSFYVPHQGLVLAEAEVDRKENEIVVASKILKQVNKGHGRIEKRTMMVSTELNDYLDWAHLAQVFVSNESSGMKSTKAVPAKWFMV